MPEGTPSADLAAGPSSTSGNVEMQELGRFWVDEVRKSLRSEGRVASGMWPGTLSEARAVLSRASATGHALATRDTREQMVRALYRVARRLWLASRDPEAIDPSVDDE